MAYPISVQLYSLRENMKDGNHIDIIRQVAAMGYPAVEPAGLHGMTPKEYRRVIEEHGMTISSSHGDFPTRENAFKLADIANDFGSPYVIAGVGTEDVANVDAIKRTADRINEGTAALKSAGLKFCLHNHWWEFNLVDGRLAMDRIVELCPNTFLQVDMYWASNFGANDVAKFVSEHKSIVPLFHVKDGPLVKGEPHTAVGSGKLDVPPIIEAADPSVLKWLVVELDECGTDMVRAVADSYNYLVSTGLGTGKKAAVATQA